MKQEPTEKELIEFKRRLDAGPLTEDAEPIDMTDKTKDTEDERQ